MNAKLDPSERERPASRNDRQTGQRLRAAEDLGARALGVADAFGAADDPGLLSPAQTSLLIDQYELAMAASYFARDMNELVAFELFVRSLPSGRDWLLAAGLGPALALVRAMRYGQQELAYLEQEGFDRDFLAYLESFRFRGQVHAIPEGSVVFAGEPLLRVVAPRIEAQLLETILLNQINFQTAIATKAARIVLAAGGGHLGAGDRVMDFSPRRDHGVDAAMKAARAAAIAGVQATSNVAAALRYGLRPAGTMAHSYVLSFAEEQEAFAAFMEDFPANTIMLVDTYDTLRGVENAITASRASGVALKGIRLDSGDLLALSRAARRMLDTAGMRDSIIVASGDLEELQIARLVAAGAPIDLYGVGTELGVARDAPTVGGVYKLVAEHTQAGWHGVHKRSPAKATLPGAKQVLRRLRAGTMQGDLIVALEEAGPLAAKLRAMPDVEVRPLLVPYLSGGEPVRHEDLGLMRERAQASLGELPEQLRRIEPAGVRRRRPYSVELIGALADAGERLDGRKAPVR
jgi:nicotinate phosphoribosyltransferase